MDIPHHGVLVTIFVSHSFSCFNDLKRDNTFSMTPKRISFEAKLKKISALTNIVEVFTSGLSVPFFPELFLYT